MVIRRAIVSDIPALVALNRTVHAMHAAAYPERFRQDPPDKVVADAFKDALDSQWAYWLLAEDRKALGFLSSEFRERAETWCVTASRVCYMAGLVVLPEYRRKGIARALLAELKREASSRGVTQIDLDVWAFNNLARQAFIGLGFKPVTERMTLSAKRPNKA